MNSVWGNITSDPDYLLSRAGTGVNFCEQDDEMLKRIEYINYGEDIANDQLTLFENIDPFTGEQYKKK